MSLRRSLLSRRIIRSSPALSRSCRGCESRGLPSVCYYSKNDNLGGEMRREDDDEDDVGGTGRGQQQQGGVVLSGESGSWGDLLPELLGDIMQRVEASEDKWPQRQNVIACGCVCKKWREATREAVEKASIHQPGKITFPSSLKKPGPHDSPVQCLIKRDKKNATFYLYLALSSSCADNGKFLLAARKYRSGVHMEYIISLDADDLSQGSNAYVGKLRSDFLGTKFTIYDRQPPHSRAKASSFKARRRVASKQISPEVPSGNFEVGHVSYKFNLLKSRGPRRMVCSLTCPPSEEISAAKEDQNDMKVKLSYLVMKNKAPIWHERLECWCLNFHGRVTIASVKNFQLVAAIDQSKPGGRGDQETVLLQFGKVGDDAFTMDYRQPLSPFTAFAICLTSFGTKLACE